MAKKKPLAWMPMNYKLNSDEENGDLDESDEENVLGSFSLADDFDGDGPSHKRAPVSENYRLKCIISEAKVASQREASHVVRTMQSSYSVGMDEAGTLLRPQCYNCDNRAVLKCMGCAPGGRFLCQHCDATCHGLSVIHNRLAFNAETGGYSPQPIPRRLWRLSHCPNCLLPQSEDSSETYQAGDSRDRVEGETDGAGAFRLSDSDVAHGSNGDSWTDGAGTANTEFAVKLHTESSGIVDVTVLKRRCTHCDYIFGSKAAEFCCTPCGTGSDWFEDSLLESMVMINEAYSSGIPWAAMISSHSARCAARGNEPLTSADARKFVEALRIYSALKYDTQRFGRITKDSIGEVVRSSECPIEFKEGLSLVHFCAACWKNGLCLTSDGSTCCRTRHSAGFSYGLPLVNSFLGKLIVDKENGDLQSVHFLAYQNCMKELMRAKKRPRQKGSKYPCLNNTPDIRDSESFSRLFRRAMLFLSCCPHYIINEENGILMRAGGRMVNIHFQLCYSLHFSGVRPMPEVFVFASVPTQLRPAVAQLYYDNACKISQYLKDKDPEALK